jgi:hypothetical protein
VDRTPPEIFNLSPENSSFTNNPRITVSAEYNDNLSGIDTTTAKLVLDGVDVTSQSIVTASGISFTPTSDLVEGFHSYTADVSDRAPNAAEQKGATFGVDITPPQILSFTPANGAVVNEPRPEIIATWIDNLSGVDPFSVRLFLDGAEVTGQAVITESGLTFIPFVDLGSGEHTVHLSVADIAGNTTEQSNTWTVQLVPPPPVPEGAAFIHGVVFNALADAPLPGAQVTVEGIEGAILTDNNGKFAFPVGGFPATGVLRRTVTIGKEGFTFAQRRPLIVVERDVAVDPVFLTPLDAKITGITPAGGTATNDAGTIEVIFPIGAVNQSIEVVITQYQNQKQLPSPLPTSSVFTYAADFKPDGVVFNSPVTVRVANALGFPPGAPIPIGAWDSEKFRWVDAGMGEVTPDGQFAEFEITHFSPYDFNNPAIVAFARSAELSEKGKELYDQEIPFMFDADAQVGLQDGNLTTTHDLPPIRILNRKEDISFAYDSRTAHPSALISATMFNDPRTAVPGTMTFIPSVEGVRKEAVFQGVGGESVYRFLWDGINARGIRVPTGSYRYDVRLTNDYQGGVFFTAEQFAGVPLLPLFVSVPFPLASPADITGRVAIDNRIDSPFGAGWALVGLQRLHGDPDGPVLITEGGRGAGVFAPAGALDPTPVVSNIFLPIVGDTAFTQVTMNGGDELFFVERQGIGPRGEELIQLSKVNV